MNTLVLGNLKKKLRKSVFVIKSYDTYNKPKNDIKNWLATCQKNRFLAIS